MIEKNVYFSTKMDTFFDRSTLTACILEPLGVQRLYVPHLKGLISGKVELKGQGRGSTITLCHAQ